MAERFGAEYLAYRERVPMLVPRLREWRRLLEASGASAEERR